jgi:hypothetical protein
MNRDANGLGLDELMIVNPGSGGAGGLLVDPDGRLVGVSPGGEPGAAGPRYFLGDDGTRYETRPERSALPAGDAGVPRYFLADDGTVYQTVP